MAPSTAAITWADESVNRLCVTSDHVTTIGPAHFHVDAGGMRATIATLGDTAELAFTYSGPSSTTALLADGELRRQIGLKLRAQDTCNLVYVMWHIEPSPGILVSVKRNPGQSTHAQCGDRGYVNVEPSTFRPVAPIRADGHAHVLRAGLVGDLLRVRADGELVWEGHLPAGSGQLVGSAGIRSDNGSFNFELRGPRVTSRSDACIPD